jgi:putative transposase
MSQSHVNLLYHIVFSTKDRQPLITEERQPRLYEFLGGLVRKRGGVTFAINGMEDHVHLLARLRQDKPVADLVRDLKAYSSGWMHRVFPELREFAWQNGYGAFTVSASQAKLVAAYIEQQKAHHQASSFEREFISLLRKNEIEYDERYL